MKRDIGRFILFISLAFSFLVIFLIFEYFMFTEAQIDLRIPANSNYEELTLLVDGKKIMIKLHEGVYFLRLRKGKHTFKILVKDVPILEDEIAVKGENPRILLNLPEPPRIRDVEYKYISNDRKIKIRWHVTSKVNFYEIFKDGLKIARVKNEEFEERFNPTEIHRYTIFPFYGGGKLKGIGKAIKVGPFVELSNLRLRIVSPYDVSVDDLVLNVDRRKVNLSDTLLAVISDVSTGSHEVEVRFKDHLILKKNIELLPGVNEKIIELPDLPTLNSATAIVMGNKIKISWIDPSNDLYKVSSYDISYSYNSENLSLSTTNTSVELPTNPSSEIRYSITPIFFGSLKGEPYEFIKLPQPSICVEDIPKVASSNHLNLPVKTCEDRTDVIFLYSIDNTDFEQVSGTSLELDLEDGVHTLKLKAIDGFYQEADATITMLIDTEPPEPAESLKATVDGDVMRVSWIESESTDVVECEVKATSGARIMIKKNSEAILDVSNASRTVTVFVNYKDRAENLSESSITVDIPRVPKLSASTVTYGGDGNDVNVHLVFQDYSGDLIVYLDSIEILHTCGTSVSFRLEDLEYDENYDLNARLRNDFGVSAMKRVTSFRTKLPKPKMIEWSYENGNLKLKIDGVGSKFLYEVIGNSYSTRIATESTVVTIPVKIPGTYLLRIKAETEDNESLESMEVIDINEGGS